jgi:hypothetical protein
MHHEAYVIVGLEFESDTPGIHKVFGPWRTYEEADTIADLLCEKYGWIRGANLQVTALEVELG